MARRSILGMPILISSLWIALMACSAEETDGEANARNYQTVPCSTSEPSVGTKCTSPMDCEYGDAVRPECRTSYGCNEATDWLWRKWPDCTEAPAGFCPKTRPEATSCALPVPCVYENVVCNCSCDHSLEVDGDCVAGIWTCYDPPTTEGCPAIVPNHGTPCSVQGLECNYGNVCDWGYSRFCYKGLWVYGSNGGLSCTE